MRHLLFLVSILLLVFSCTKEPDPMPEDQNKLPVEFSNLFNIFEGKGIGDAANLSDDILLLFSTDGTDFAWFEDGTIKRTGKLSEEDGLFDGLAFSTVGAAIDYDEERLIFFNKVGGTYQWVEINPDLIPGGSGIDSIFDFFGRNISIVGMGA